MSTATHYQAPDFSDIDAMDLSEEAKEQIRQARIEAETIRAGLVSEHITSQEDLLTRLEATMETARNNAAFLGDVNLKEFDRAQKGRSHIAVAILNFFTGLEGVVQGPHTADLEVMNLPDDVKQRVIRARISAEMIRVGLASARIMGWEELLTRLEAAMAIARNSAAFPDGVNLEELGRAQKSRGRLTRLLRRLSRLFGG